MQYVVSNNNLGCIKQVALQELHHYLLRLVCATQHICLPLQGAVKIGSKFFCLQDKDLRTFLHDAAAQYQSVLLCHHQYGISLKQSCRVVLLALLVTEAASRFAPVLLNPCRKSKH